MDSGNRKAPASPHGASPVDGLVLAAGRSSRMGRDKADLDLDGSTFLERAVATLRAGGCRAVVAVLPGEQEPGNPLGATSAVNPDPGSEQIVSIRIGLSALSGDTAAVLVLPVDAPAVRAETVRSLIAAFQATGAPIVRPVHAGQPGHPTLFARAVFADLARDDLARGAETVVERHAAERLDVPVEDPGVTTNVNTPDDYLRLREGP